VREALQIGSVACYSLRIDAFRGEDMKPLPLTLGFASRCVVATFFVAAICGACSAAPRELLGKSVRARVVATLIVETTEGKTFPQQITGDHVIYISTRGRVFERTNQVDEAGSDRKSNNYSHEPGELNWAFRGNNLGFSKTEIGVHVVHTISFDASFRTCHYSAQFRIVGPIGQAGLLRVRSVTVDPSSCTIQDGNALSN
jgi:hypothetical protein